MKGEERQVSVPVRDSSGPIEARRYAAVVAAFAFILCVVTVFFSRPYVEQWLSLRAAYSQLWDSNWDERQEAYQWLLSHGEDPDAELLEMLNHPAQGYRLFAAQKLSSGPAKPEITEAFLRLLGDDEYLQEFDGPFPREDFCRDAIRGLGHHAESAVGPLSDTDEEVILLLQPMLTTSNQLGDEAAQVLADYLPQRAELAGSLKPYSDSGFLYGNMKVVRGFYRSDPAELPTYLNLLLEGLSSDGFSRQRASTYLKELGPDAEIAVPELEILRTNSPQLAGEIEQILDAIRRDPGEPN